MDYHEWIGYCNLTKFSKDIGVSSRVTQNIKLSNHSPTLLNALKLYYASDKVLNLDSLLSKKDRTELRGYKVCLSPEVSDEHEPDIEDSTI